MLAWSLQDDELPGSALFRIWLMRSILLLRASVNCELGAKKKALYAETGG
jgi:hypothetical protein